MTYFNSISLSHLFRCSCSRSSLCSISPNVMSLSESSPPPLSRDFAESSAFPQGHSSTRTSRETQVPVQLITGTHTQTCQMHTNLTHHAHICACMVNRACMSIVLHTHTQRLHTHCNKTYGTPRRQIIHRTHTNMYVINNLQTAPVSLNITEAIPRSHKNVFASRFYTKLRLIMSSRAVL